MNQHIRRVEWDNVFSDNNANADEGNPVIEDIPDEDDDQIPSKLHFVKHNRPSTDQIDEETKAYTDLCTAQLRNLKPKLKKQFMNGNNLSQELQSSL